MCWLSTKKASANIWLNCVYFYQFGIRQFLKITDEQMLLSCQNCIQLRFSSNELVFHWNYEKIGLLFPWDWDMMWFHKNHQFDSIFTLCFLDHTDSRLQRIIFKEFWQLWGVHNDMCYDFWKEMFFQILSPSRVIVFLLKTKASSTKIQQKRFKVLYFTKDH